MTAYLANANLTYCKRLPQSNIKVDFLLRLNISKCVYVHSSTVGHISCH